jgi:ABC-type amino acid transport substrate-binding protein
VVVAPFTKAEALRGFQLLATPQPNKVYTKLPPGFGQAGGEPASLAQIRDRGVLRVCYLPHDFPSAYLNNEDPPQLVGFDIEMAHRFARSLGLPLEFLPVANEIEAAGLLNKGSCDMFMTALPVSLRSAEKFAMTIPVYTSSVGLIVKDSRRDQFRTWEDIRNQGAAFRVAIPDTPNAHALAKDLMKDATLVPYRDKAALKKILESGAPDVDAIASMSEEGAAWTLLYPNFSLVVPRPTVFNPVAYAFALGNEKFLEAFDAWLVAEKSRGTVDQLYRHWMLGEALQVHRPQRWSVIRNVLHWVN